MPERPLNKLRNEGWNVRNNPLHKGTKKNNNKPKSNRPHATRKTSNASNGSAASFNFNFFEKVFKGGDPHSAALKVLGFEARDDPTEKEISKAYKKKALATHPNRGGTKEKFQTLQAAFEFLTGERNSFENNAEEKEVRTPPPEPAPEPKPKRSVFGKAKGVDPYAGMTKEEAAAAEKRYQNAFREANAAYRAAAEEAPRAAAVPPHMRGTNPGTRGMAEKIAAGLRAGRFNMGNGKMGSATWNYLHSKRGGGKTRRLR
jgi:hypothetical protein